MTHLIIGDTQFIGLALAQALIAVDPKQAPVLCVAPHSEAGPMRDLGVRVIADELDAIPDLDALLAAAEVLYLVPEGRFWQASGFAPAPGARFVDYRPLIAQAQAAGVGKIIICSSAAVLTGGLAAAAVDERSAVSLEGVMECGLADIIREQIELEKFIKENDAPVVWVHMTLPAGGGDFGPSPLGQILIAAAKGERGVFSNRMLNIIDAGDLGHGLAQAGRQGQIGARYILAGGAIDLDKLLNMIASFNGRKSNFRKMPRGLGRLLRRIFNRGLKRASGFLTPRRRHDFICSSYQSCYELGLKPEPVDHAIKQALGWYREHGYLR